MYFKGDIIITDPCYICKDADWEKSKYGDHMEALGIKNYIQRDTLYGDWSCTTFRKGDNAELGNFCADAGRVGVFLLDEVLTYNPEFDYHINKPWTTTLIKDFDGNVDFEVKHITGVYEDTTQWWNKGDVWEDDVVTVIGNGNVNFYTVQTGY